MPVPDSLMEIGASLPPLSSQPRYGRRPPRKPGIGQKGNGDIAVADGSGQVHQRTQPRTEFLPGMTGIELRKNAQAAAQPPDRHAEIVNGVHVGRLRGASHLLIEPAEESRCLEPGVIAHIQGRHCVQHSRALVSTIWRLYTC